jgi:hypothetical protein
MFSPRNIFSLKRSDFFKLGRCLNRYRPLGVEQARAGTGIRNSQFEPPLLEPVGESNTFRNPITDTDDTMRHLLRRGAGRSVDRHRGDTVDKEVKESLPKSDAIRSR